MSNQYQARWVSKRRHDELRKTALAGKAVLLDSFNGFLIVEPVGSDFGDGDVLTPETADYELGLAWILSPPAKLREARRLLGLEAQAPQGELAGAGRP